MPDHEVVRDGHVVTDDFSCVATIPKGDGLQGHSQESCSRWGGRDRDPPAVVDPAFLCGREGSTEGRAPIKPCARISGMRLISST